MSRNKKWSIEICIEEAKKYKSRAEWIIGHTLTYYTARNNRWLSQCTAHMKLIRPAGYWNLETCKKEALKYDRPSDWSKGHLGSYNKAIKNKWLKECTEHMMTRVTTKWTNENILEISKLYNKKNEWCKKEPHSYYAAKRHNIFDECTKHMNSGLNK